jgi:hypothetical protein
VTPTESLFYTPGPTGDERHKRQATEFVPVFLDELTLTDDQRNACENNVECLFDLAVTGDMDFANNTLMEGKEANATIEVLSK